MKSFAYIVCWDDVHYNVIDNIEKQFINYGQPHKIINSGNMKRDHWDNVGDIRYYRQFYKALKEFDESNDYMLFICGDVSCDNWADVLDRMDKVLTVNTNVRVYAPHFTNDPWNEGSTMLKRTDDENLIISTNTNGIMYALHKDVVKFMLEYMEYLDHKNDLSTMVSGWGIDVVWSAYAIYLNKIVLRDSKILVTHPSGSSYNHGKATQETIAVMQAFSEFAKIKGFDVNKINTLSNKINGRMARDPSCMSTLDFYESEPQLVNPISIDYHVIYINDERINNRNMIDSIISGTRQDIKSLNAKDPGLLSEFYIDNPEFRVSIQPKLGEIGNFGSHYLAWKYLINSNLNFLLVFEDDSIIHEDFMEKYALALSSVPEDFDVLSIYIDSNQYDRFHQSDHVNKYIAKGYQDWSTLCYLVSRQGAEKLVRYVVENGMDYPTDWFIFRHGHAGLFNVYTLAPGFHSPLEIDKQYESQVQ